ncbi:hypothetical protein [Marilutibacter spongiae]|uniref:Uncharacterized protein n=1 Tax=Marilutibacter spongiae TaxID=2025720 RepID=A0A7W3TML3_9GAMM|nr:hypothetical protein [Lysobacter spongiae]MBB1061130.1 hypothetical protein [Lysobacter spongiae]
MKWLALGACLVAGPVAAAQPTSMPAPPEAPEWFEHIETPTRLTVLVADCDAGPAPPQVGAFRAWRLDDGTLRVEGWVGHNGSQRVDVRWAKAWTVGPSLELAYRYQPEPHPGMPVMMCPAFSRLRFDVSGIGTMPRDVSIHAGRFVYDQKASVEIADPPAQAARP